MRRLEKIVSVRSHKMVFQTMLTFALVFLIQLIMGVILAIKFSNDLASNIQYVRKTGMMLSEKISPNQLEIKTQRRAG